MAEESSSEQHSDNSALLEATTGELVAELQRRCVGLLLIAVRYEEKAQGDASVKPDWDGNDAWWARVKGSPMLIESQFRFLKEFLAEYTKRMREKSSAG